MDAFGGACTAILTRCLVIRLAQPQLCHQESKIVLFHKLSHPILTGLVGSVAELGGQSNSQLRVDTLLAVLSELTDF